MAVLSLVCSSMGYTVAAAGALLLLFFIGHGIHRVFLSPVSRVPGPFLAKLTYWYEFYYDVILGGQYTFKIRELHKQYGPIIRINPHEVHISDPDFYDVVNAPSVKKLSKWKWQVDPFDIEDSVFSAIDYEVHRVRRAPLNRFFSKAKVRSLQPRVDLVIDKFLSRTAGFQESGEPMRIDHAFGCLANDIATEYALGRSYNRIEDKDFDPMFQESCIANVVNSHMMRHLPWLLHIMTHWLPISAVMYLDPNFASFFRDQNDIKAQVREVRANHGKEKYNFGRETILHEIMNSHAPASEKRFTSLWQNGQTIIIAGTATTAATLTTIIVHLLENGDKLKILRDELRSAIPNLDNPVNLVAIEQLPYLTGVINEGLRLGSGVSTRLPRIDPESPTTFIDRFKHQGKRYIIPSGSPMSMTSMLTHFDPTIYADPQAFKPERWIGENAVSERYLTPFSKGTRACLGINLAYAELYLTLAQLFRRYGGSESDRMDDDLGYLELYETSKRDIEIVKDCTVPLWPADSKGVRVLVKNYL